MTAASSSFRTHCLSPSRVHSSTDALTGPARYARMFPELPSFEADESFLHTIITLLDRDPGSVRFAGSSWEPRHTLIDLFLASATTSVV